MAIKKKFLLILFFIFFGIVFSFPTNNSKKLYVHESGYFIDKETKVKINELTESKIQFIQNDKILTEEIKKIRYKMNNDMISENDTSNYKAFKKKILYLMKERELLRKKINSTFKHEKPYRERCNSCKD